LAIIADADVRDDGDIAQKTAMDGNAAALFAAPWRPLR